MSSSSFTGVCHEWSHGILADRIAAPMLVSHDLVRSGTHSLMAPTVQTAAYR